MVGTTTVVLAMIMHWYVVLVVSFAAYVVWMFVRIPLERRTRLCQIDPTWHRGRRYLNDGSARHE